MLYIDYKKFFVFIQVLVMCAGVTAVYAQERPAPEISTKFIVKQEVTAKKYMAVTSNPLATRAALNVLESGGSAADAGIAAQLVLGLVEPQSSGIGGGAFALYYDKESGELSSWDGRETAPEMAWAEMFLNAEGEKMAFYDAVIGGRSVGVPGTPALLHMLYKEYGRLPVKSVFKDAIELASNGFEISPRLAAMIEADKGKLDRYESTKSYFYNEDGSAKRVGQKLINQDYARVLKKFRDNGLSYFYQNMAKEITKAVQIEGGFINETDFHNYTLKERAPVCGVYRGYTICSMDQPSSGGLTILQILGLLERFDLSEGVSARTIHLISEASRLAFADRNEYMADPEFIEHDNARLISKGYLDSRAQLINENKKQENVNAGKIDNEAGTSHISVVDSYGNILSMTTTIEGAFGSKIMTNGFLLNNELTDFNFEPDTANSAAPGKRPRSSMAPTIVFDKNNKPFLIVGSAGGSRIIGYVLLRIIAMIDWNMGVQQALDMPHFLARSDMIELDPELQSYKPNLEEKGHNVSAAEMNSGLTAILFKDGLIHGAADPRREGTALGK